MVADNKAAAKRAGLESEAANAQEAARSARQEVARLEREETELKRGVLQLHMVLARMDLATRANSAEAKELIGVNARLDELSAARDQADVALEGANRAIQHVEGELESLLYGELPAFLADQAEREKALAAMLAKLEPLYREVEALWAEIQAEYQALAQALRDRLRDHESERGVRRDPGVYGQASQPRAFPLPPGSQITGLLPTPEGVAELEALLAQRSRKAA